MGAPTSSAGRGSAAIPSRQGETPGRFCLRGHEAHHTGRTYLKTAICLIFFRLFRYFRLFRTPVFFWLLYTRRRESRDRDAGVRIRQRVQIMALIEAVWMKANHGAKHRGIGHMLQPQPARVTARNHGG